MLLVCLRRVSSDSQLDGVGLARQSDAAAAYAKARKWDLHPEIYSDEGVSGFSGANFDGDLGRFLEDLKRGHFGDAEVALGIEDLDRLSRQFPLTVLSVVVDDLINAGVTISVLAMGRDISRESIKKNGMELHELLFWMGAAHDFSAKLSGRIADQRGRIRAAIRDGKPAAAGTAPSWISLVNGDWQLNEYSVTVRRIIAMAQDGDGSMAIARAMNDAKIPAPGAVLARRKLDAGGRQGPRPARPIKDRWHTTSVLQILKSPALHGARKVAAPGYNDTLREWKAECARLVRQGIGKEKLPKRPPKELEHEQPNYYPALLTAEEHELLLAQVARRRTTGTPGRVDQCTWIAQRLTRCICGANMTASSSSCKRGGKVLRYQHLRCNGRRDGTGCTAPMTPLHHAESNLLTRLSQASISAILGADPDATAQQELNAALIRRDSAALVLRGIETKAEAGEQALAQADDAAVLTVLAKRQAGLAAEIAAARLVILEINLEIDQLNRRTPVVAATEEARAAATTLLQTFARHDDTPADRQRINEHLRRMNLRVIVDGDERQVGLQVGDGEIDWQPLSPAARRRSLQEGLVDPALALDTIDGRPLVLSADGRSIWDSTPPEDPELLAAYHRGQQQALEDLKRAAAEGSQ
jgi:DNA invertase Pin-like site-specific DNA recombinase